MAITKDTQDPKSDILSSIHAGEVNEPANEAAVLEQAGVPTGEEAPIEPTLEVPEEAPVGGEKSFTEKVADELRGGDSVTADDTPEAKAAAAAEAQAGQASTESDAGNKGEADLISDWDVVPEDNKGGESTNQKSDYSEISTYLGLSGSTKEEVFNEVSSLRDELKSLKENNGNSQFANDAIREANEIASKGGDWQQYLSVASADLSNVSDRDLVKHETLNLLGAKASDVDIDEHLDGMSASDLRIQAAQIRQRHESDKANLKADLERRAQENKRIIDNGIKDALGNVSDVAGFQVKDAQKQQIFADLTSGKGFNDMFYDQSGNYDFNKIIRNQFIIKNFDSIVNYLKSKGSNNGARKVLDTLQNVDTGSPSKQSQEANINGEKTERSPIEAIMEGFKSGNPIIGQR